MYSCYECKTKVGQDYFTSTDGRILCDKCSARVKPCTDTQKFLCEAIEEGYYYFYKFDLLIKLGIYKMVSEIVLFMIWLSKSLLGKMLLKII